MHLVSCHPVSTSLCAQLAAHAEAELVLNGHEVDRLDLYEAGFSPVLTAEERAGYYGTPAPGSDIVPLQMRLMSTEHLVLVFPTWWFSVPAALKGWLDRVWSPGIAFSQGTPIVPLLTNLRSVTVITTLGSPWWFDRVIMRSPVRHMLKLGVIDACAPRASFTMLSLHSAETASASQVKKFMGKIGHALGRVVRKG
ncbi:NAD(P)H-dependent oxidoreductase [Devosia equisanguinis]|uniref:NAD(P)H-dependent oxidoreductase n=1 Tax=Devosia equisanguinis TaxID=2490941 RepID=UPI001CB77275|nr:NAD(P)H-dependent oxidoreductase [Devosia equisanguinis]